MPRLGASAAAQLSTVAVWQDNTAWHFALKSPNAPPRRPPP